MEWEDYADALACDAEYFCFQCAKSNGHTEEEVENCDDGDVGCPDCPFKTNELEEVA